jgi:hypothetical protein
MDEKQRGMILGCLVICIGILLLLSNLDILHLSNDISIGGIFLLVGITLIAFYFDNTKRFHLLIGGEILGIIGLTIILSVLQIIAAYYRSGVTGVTLLWGLAFIFATVYLTQRKQSWSLLPMGVFLTNGAVVLLSTLRWLDTGNLWVVTLAGLGLSFGLVFLVDLKRHLSQWAKYPALVFLSIALLVLFLNNRNIFLSQISFSVILILFGGLLVFWGLRKRT